MLSCRQLVEQSGDLLDGPLSVRQRLALQLHLMLCGNCRRFMRQLRLGQQVLRQLPRGQSAELDQLAERLARARHEQS